MQVRRAQPGDPLVLFDGRGGEWDGRACCAWAASRWRVRIGAHDPAERESPLAVTLALGMPANERMDTLVEKATELGVAAIQPLLTERSVLRLDGERAERKRAHWQARGGRGGRTVRPHPGAGGGAGGHAGGTGWRAGPAADAGPRWLLSPDAPAQRPRAAGPAAR